MAPDDDRLVVYIDADGTVLYETDGGSGIESLDDQHVCEGLGPFLEFVVAHCEPHWLTYRAWRGDATRLPRDVLPHLPEVASRIPAAQWDESKSEAIDPRRPFVWFDDYLEPEDEDWLERHGVRDSFVLVEPTCPVNPVRMLSVLKQRLDRP